MNKITIIGAGNVGSTIAYTLVYAGIASEIVLIDINMRKAEGEALDIRQGTPYSLPCNIYAGTYEDAKDSDIVIITSGVARKPGQSRLELAQVNVNIIKEIIPSITASAPEAMYVLVCNPVDVLTYTFCKLSGIPEARVIGTGTLLDTSRLRSRLAEYYKINQKNVHAYVLGEHGDSSLIPWSLINLSNIPVLDYANYIAGNSFAPPPLDIEEIETYVRKSGGTIIERKGSTFYAVAVATCHICKCILSGVNTALTVSSMMHGEYGIDDVCLSVLCNVGKNGISGKLLLPLTEEERLKLVHSADCLKEIIRGTVI